MVLRYCRGGGFDRHLKERRYQWKQSLIMKLLTQVASALEFLHMNGVVHHDIKVRSKPIYENN
jgi:serine/threonine protein kinase